MLSSNTFICALSGQTPISDPVCTPSGHICSKRLLLTKLSETNGFSPFTAGGDAPVELDESMLIDLCVPGSGSGSGGGSGGGAGSVLIPPSTTNSIPTLLSTLQSEYDAMVLELYDTRKGLEETRRELSTALYQNDAAVRVIARVVLERDMARKELMEVVANGPPVNANDNRKAGTVNVVPEEEGPVSGEKRGREEEDVPPAKRGRDSSPTPQDSSTIPAEHMTNLTNKWNQLSSLRKTVKKKEKALPKEHFPSLSKMEQWTCQSKNWHKMNSKGGLTMVSHSTVLTPQEDESGVKQDIVTYGKDKHVMVFDLVEKKVKKDVHIKSSIIANSGSCMDYCVVTGAGEDCKEIIASVTKDGNVRVYTESKGESVEATPVCVFKEGASTTAEEQVVGMALHPSGKYVIVVTSIGTIHLVAISDDGTTLTTIASLEDQSTKENKSSCTTCALHPDGLILAIGKSDGSVSIWDLKTQKLGSTVRLADTSATGSIYKLVFSENGYHLAASSSNQTVTVWDLRKCKVVTTLSTKSGSDGETEAAEPQTHSLAFDPYGKFLAYGTSADQVTIATVKDWDKKVVLGEVNATSSMSGIVWGHQGKSLMTCSDSGRGVSFWGLHPKDP